LAPSYNLTGRFYVRSNGSTGGTCLIRTLTRPIPGLGDLENCIKDAYVLYVTAAT
jgi:hypothetical protein